MVDYFIVGCRLDQVDRYLIWISGDEDLIAINEAKRVLTFFEIDEALAYTRAQGWSLIDEVPEFYNLDLVKDWLNYPLAETIRRAEFLAAWNLFTDISKATGDIGFEGQGELIDLIYNKLFWGNNLPSVTPVGRSFNPICLLTSLLNLSEFWKAG